MAFFNYIAYCVVEHNGRPHFSRKVELTADSDCEAFYAAEKFCYDSYAARSGTKTLCVQCVKLHRVSPIVKPHFID